MIAFILRTQSCKTFVKKIRKNNKNISRFVVVHVTNLTNSFTLATNLGINSNLKIYETFMDMALEEAKKASGNGEVPIGAIIVRELSTLDYKNTFTGEVIYKDTTKNGNIPRDIGTSERFFEILGKGKNEVENLNDASAHAEIQAMRDASIHQQNWRLRGAVLHTTLEPCPMCLASCQAFRINSIIWGASDLRLGAIKKHVSYLDLAEHPYQKFIVTFGGIKKDESSRLLVNFFRKRRIIEQSKLDNRGKYLI